MINLWEYEYCGKVKIVDMDEKTFVGKAKEVTDAGERSDNEPQEDGITIDCDGTLVEFYRSEIKLIEKL